MKRSLTKLSSPLAVNRGAGPVVRPRHIPVLAQRNHRLDREGHARLALADSLVLRVVWDVGRTVEQAVDAVATVCPDDAAVVLLGLLLDDVAELTYQNTRLDRLDGFVQTLARGLHDPHVLGVRLRLVTDIVCLVEIGVVALVVDGHVDVEDVAVDQEALVRNAVADDLVGRCTAGLGEVVVVERGRIGLEKGV